MYFSIGLLAETWRGIDVGETCKVVAHGQAKLETSKEVFLCCIKWGFEELSVPDDSIVEVLDADPLNSVKATVRVLKCPNEAVVNAIGTIDSMWLKRATREEAEADELNIASETEVDSVPSSEEDYLEFSVDAPKYSNSTLSRHAVDGDRASSSLDRSVKRMKKALETHRDDELDGPDDEYPSQSGSVYEHVADNIRQSGPLSGGAVVAEKSKSERAERRKKEKERLEEQAKYLKEERELHAAGMLTARKEASDDLSTPLDHSLSPLTSKHHTPRSIPPYRLSPGAYSSAHYPPNSSRSHAHGPNSGSPSPRILTPRGETFSLPTGALKLSDMQALSPFFSKGVVTFTDLLRALSDGRPRTLSGEYVRTMASWIKSDRFRKLAFLGKLRDCLTSVNLLKDRTVEFCFDFGGQSTMEISTPASKKFILESKHTDPYAVHPKNTFVSTTSESRKFLVKNKIRIKLSPTGILGVEKDDIRLCAGMKFNTQVSSLHGKHQIETDSKKRPLLRIDHTKQAPLVVNNRYVPHEYEDWLIIHVLGVETTIGLPPLSIREGSPFVSPPRK
jgi:hypothetical protein